ncbi:LysR family transcriptional regulator [Cryptosporangium aurantiacum]|uniref:Transcriptional regulator, LysR family n=1 Tax=Cryptosporangium aurantiacum TaxID=134849 RepID=A0A1M7RMJ3_9ACTN|nr:LysR family transcriptional regulator [Cryptosporangium aurantiacum]SHN47308.1 transcriptional regulator, LysR family [Cryptosporangium aurantiacum]
MELRQLRYFLVAAEELHLGRAAALMHITQPAFSQQIRRLERQLGVRLLEVSSNKIRLTTAGEVFVEEARRTLQQADEAAETARRAARGELGRLSVGFVATAARRVLPTLLGRLRERYPGVTPVLHQLWTAEQMEALRRHRLHVGFVLGGITDPAFGSRVLLREPFVVLLPDAHPLAARGRVRLDDLSAEPLVLFRRDLNPVLYDRITRLARRDETPSEPVYEIEHASAIPVLVAAGHGVALVSRSRADEFSDPGVVRLPLLDPPVSEELRMVWRASDDSGLLTVVQELVSERLAATPP